MRCEFDVDRTAMVEEEGRNWTKTPISFWYRRGLNPRSLIQPSETLPVDAIAPRL